MAYSYGLSGKYSNICGMCVMNPEQRSDSLGAVQLQNKSEFTLYPSTVYRGGTLCKAVI